MICNKKITIYHKGFDTINHLETWTRYNYTAWFFGGEGSGINKGYDNANNVDIRIPYDKNDNLNIANFGLGDIIIGQELDINISKQSELESYKIYNITSINDNNFGNNKHIHIGGK